MVKNLRSLIHEKFPLELRVQIDLLSRRRDISKEEKPEAFIKLLREWGFTDINQLGPGTNRYAIRLDGFVVKVATDNDGKIDNLKEFKMAKRLYPYVAKTYEVSENGSLLVAEYVQSFQSYAEMLTHADRIREILSELSSVYLIGDVGITGINYGNWGLRVGTNEVVCLDFAYIYEVRSEIFICRYCKTNSMLVPDKDFVALHCSNPACGKKYDFADIRSRIGNDVHRLEIGDLSEEGYRLFESNVPTEITEQRSEYLTLKKDDKKKKAEEDKKHETLEETIEYDNFEMEHPPSYYRDQGNIKEEDLTIMSMENVFDAASSKKPTVSVVKARVIANETVGTGKIIKGRVINLEPISFESQPSVQKEVPTEPSTPKVEIFSGPITAAPVTRHMKEKSPNHENGVKEEEPTQYIDKNEPKKAKVITRKTETGENINKAAVVRAKVVSEGKPQNNDTLVKEPKPKEQEAVKTSEPKPETQIQGKTNEPKDAISEIQYIATKLAIEICWDLEQKDIYDQILPSIKNKGIMAGKFYSELQSVLFRSIADFFELQSTKVYDQTENRYRKKYSFAKDPSEEPFFPSVVVLLRLWDMSILGKKQSGEETMAAYRSIYGEGAGIQASWLPILKRLMKNRLPVDDAGIIEVVQIIEEIWCEDKTPRKSKAAENPDEIMVDAEPESTDMNPTSEEADESVQEAVDEPVGEESVAKEEEPGETEITDADYQEALNYSEAAVDVTGQVIEDPSDDDQEDDVDVYADENLFIGVEAIQDHLMDTIRISASDDTGFINIPIYGKFFDESGNLSLAQGNIDYDYQSDIDERNGVWDWLANFMPDLVFHSKDPDKWMEYNDYEFDEGDSMFKFVILDTPSTTGEDFIMGIYCISKIVKGMNSENLDTWITSGEELKALNAIIGMNIRSSQISHRTRSVIFDLDNDAPRTEDNIMDFINAFIDADGISDDESDDDDEGESEELTEQERAAIAALKLTPPDKKPSNPDTFTPIHRKDV